MLFTVFVIIYVVMFNYSFHTEYIGGEGGSERGGGGGGGGGV